MRLAPKPLRIVRGCTGGRFRAVIALVLFCSVVGALIGCDGGVATRYPLSLPYVSEPDQRLVGIWRSADRDLSEADGLLHVEIREDGRFDAIAVSHNPSKGLSLEQAEVISGKLGEELFLSLRHKAKQSKVSGGGYLFLRYTISGDTIELFRLSPAAVREAVKKKQLRARLPKTEKGVILITDTFANLDKFIKNSEGASLWEKINRLVRVSGKSPLS